MNIVIVGHVDHGKSTIIGRLLADTGSLPDGKLEFVRETCRRNSRPFEYAFLLDALKDEQAQGITIDSARCFFRSDKREYIIIDAPGHIEFLKNMVTGAARAEAALLVIDANEGVQENSRRHGYMLALLGIKKVVVLINKMDLVKYDQKHFEQVKHEYAEFLSRIGIHPAAYIPVSGMEGDNVATLSNAMEWYHHQTVLDALDAFAEEAPLHDKPFRMPVQGVYKFTRGGDTRRIVAGTVESGTLKTGDSIVFYPSGKKSTVRSIEEFNYRGPGRNPEQVSAGQAVGFTLEDHIFVSRGNMAALMEQTLPQVTSRIKTSIFWLGREPMIPGRDYILKSGTARATVQLEEILSVTDASSLDNIVKTSIERHDIAECIIKSDKDIAFDLSEDVLSTSRFVIVDGYEISGGGIIREALSDSKQSLRDKILLRSLRWVSSHISEERRAERYNQKPTLIMITGKRQNNRKRMAKHLEKWLFDEGKFVYFLSMGNLLYGVDADIKSSHTASPAPSHEDPYKPEHFRRLAEVSNIMLDAGLILVVSAAELAPPDLQILQTAIEPEKIVTVWLGDEINTGLRADLHIRPELKRAEVLASIKALLQKRGIIFKV